MTITPEYRGMETLFVGTEKTMIVSLQVEANTVRVNVTKKGVDIDKESWFYGSKKLSVTDKLEIMKCAMQGVFLEMNSDD